MHSTAYVKEFVMAFSAEALSWTDGMLTLLSMSDET